ncbi:Potassium channel subfamily K member 18-like protein [Dinothrombium tinctorium]|uniref:Potassium channel subfamily K member 18-like protein n=1 Tax=Dinothrombium tinctorium TaxID=1965070 RepID=A0A3S3S2B1_9ACAR|nr:Potassium channel subfamily K member 18-like protein [Dinothrombium tinctorium]
MEKIEKIRRRSRMARFRYYCRLVSTFLFSHLGLCAIVIAYSSAGAAIFQKLEADYENEVREKVERERDLYAEKLWQITKEQKLLRKENWTANAETVLNEYEEYLFNMTKESGFNDKDKDEAQRWTYWGSLLYAVVVITTIGYRDRAPRTKEGKVGTIIYAVIGIPLMFVFLRNIGRFMANCCRFLYWKFCVNKERKRRNRKRRRRQRRIEESVPMKVMQTARYTLDRGEVGQVPIITNKYVIQKDSTLSTRKNQHLHDQDFSEEDEDDYSYDESDKEDEDYRTTKVPIKLCVALILGYLCIGANLFRYLEQWDFFPSFYFCFITLTTIGFGDMVPGQTLAKAEADQTLTLVICAVYLILGMGLLAMSLTLVGETVRNKITAIGKRIGIIEESDSE